MILIKLPVMWHEKNIEAVSLIEMGIDASQIEEKKELGEIYINPEYISHINECDEFTNVWVNEQVFKVPLAIKEVIALLRNN